MRPLVPVLSLLVLTGCTLSTDYFGEYRGVNLLGNYDFDAVDSGGAPKWKLAPSTSSDFMTWERIGPTSTDPARDTAASVPTVGPDGVSPVYRVEIKNLIPNGDFEDASKTGDGQTTLPAFWSTSDYLSNPVAIASLIKFGPSPSTTALPGALDGRALGWSASQAGDQLRLDLHAGAVSLATNAWSASRYRFRSDLINVSDKFEVGLFLYTSAGAKVDRSERTSSARLQPGDWTVSTLLADNSADHTSRFGVSEFFLTETDPSLLSTEGRILVFGANDALTPYAAVIDNLRLVPDDQVLGVQAVFPRLDSGTKPLLPGSREGMYVFSVFVRNDPTANTLNRFSPADVSIVLKARTKAGDKSDGSKPSGLRPAGGWSTWTKLTFNLGFDFVNNDQELAGANALTITISPTSGSAGHPDAGSLLISQPVLTFNP